MKNTWKLNGVIIPFAIEVKYLETTLDESLIVQDDLSKKGVSGFEMNPSC